MTFFENKVTKRWIFNMIFSKKKKIVFFYLIFFLYNATPDTWHLTPDTWHLACDTPAQRIVNIVSKCQDPISYGLGIMVFFIFFTKGDWFS